MELSVATPENRTVHVSATLDELVDLHDALVAQRKTKKQRQILRDLSELLVNGDRDLANVLIGRREGAEG